jgi:plastocyanin
MTRTLTFAAALLASLALVGCGSDDGGDPTPADMNEPEPPSGDAGPQAFNGCSANSYEDRSADGAERVVQIAVEGLKFTPPCLQIAVGQSVRFDGSLTSHPLAPGNPDDHEAGSPNTPIVRTSSGRSVEFTFAAAGTYPYYCELHAFGAGMGMAGAIYVQ